tara:strand:+ start:184 stop:1062 length:879 start_codon:yes stop_codon:yes gene_type:complete
MKKRILNHIINTINQSDNYIKELFTFGFLFWLVISFVANDYFLIIPAVVFLFFRLHLLLKDYSLKKILQFLSLENQDKINQIIGEYGCFNTSKIRPKLKLNLKKIINQNIGLIEYSYYLSTKFRILNSKSLKEDSLENVFLNIPILNKNYICRLTRSNKLSGVCEAKNIELSFDYFSLSEINEDFVLILEDEMFWNDVPKPIKEGLLINYFLKYLIWWFNSITEMFKKQNNQPIVYLARIEAFDFQGNISFHNKHVHNKYLLITSLELCFFDVLPISNVKQQTAAVLERFSK